MVEDEDDDYDVFLDGWEPSEALNYATLQQNLGDPYSYQKMLDDTSSSAKVRRNPNVTGTRKEMTTDESFARKFEFFKENQDVWAEHFCDYVLGKDVPISKLEVYLDSFKRLWVDGRSKRQNSNQMMEIKASIHAHDRAYYPISIKEFVINPVPSDVTALFKPWEMKAIFEANSGLIDALLPDYTDHLNSLGQSSQDDIYLRRGVCLPETPTIRKELNYLSSYSLAMGPVEQFAQTGAKSTQFPGQPMIFSAPVGAFQNRIVAFAGFITGMDLGQLEFVVAPPTQRMELRDCGRFGCIQELSF